MCGLSSGSGVIDVDAPAPPVRRTTRGSLKLAAQQTPPQLPPRTSPTFHVAAADWDNATRFTHLFRRPEPGANTSAPGAPEPWLTDYTDEQLQHNLKLAPWIGCDSARLGCSPASSGIWPYEAPAGDALRCGEHLKREWLPTGKLDLPDGPALQGYNSYPTVRARGQVDKRLQRAQTLRIGPESLWRAMQFIPGFGDIARASAAAVAEANVLDISRLELGSAHMLLQAEDSDRSTAFAMHRDTEDDPETVYTTIAMLTPTPAGTPRSQMCIAGGTAFSYGTKAGSGCFFLSDFYHASGPSVAGAAKLKVAMFWRVKPRHVVRVEPKKKQRKGR